MRIGPTTRPAGEAVIVLLASMTMAAYGSWIYAFGVLLDDLVADLGAREGALVAAFGAAQLLAGVGSVIAGRTLDRRGSTPVFLGGAFGAVILGSSALATTPLAFSVLYAIGSGFVGACGFYHISQTCASRLFPGRETHAITRLTLYAAFSSPVFYPLTAWLVQRGGWQLGVTVAAAMTAVLFLAAIGAAPTPPTDREGSHRLTIDGFRGPARRYALGVIIATGTVQVLSVYQVPVMVASGLALGTASTLAGARGIAQFLGRLPLARLAARFGAAPALRVSIAMLAVGTGMLAFSDSVVMAGAAMLITGLAIGAQSPLVGIRGREVFDERVLGTALGTVTLGTFVAGAVTPVAAGALVEASGTRLAAVALGVAVAVLATIIVGGDR
ncbi:MAG: MFS transporter [Acidimicrobiia bacterium]